MFCFGIEESGGEEKNTKEGKTGGKEEKKRRERKEKEERRKKKVRGNKSMKILPTPSYGTKWKKEKGRRKR